MGISQKIENDVLISSKAKRKDERDALDKEISSIINKFYGDDSYQDRFSKLELNYIARYSEEIKEIVILANSPEYKTSQIKEFLKNKRDTSQYKVKKGFVYQKVTPKVKSKKQKKKELEKNKIEEIKKSDKLKNQKQLKLRFEPKLGFELTLRDCNTIITEIKPYTPFNIKEKDIDCLCQRVKKLKKRDKKGRTLRQLFDLEKQNAVNNKRNKNKIVRKYRYNPKRTLIKEELRKEFNESRIGSEMEKKQNYWGSNY